MCAIEMSKCMTPKEIVDGASSVLKDKGDDYGARGKNFSEAAQLATIISGLKTSPLQVAACLIGIKLSRYGNLLSKPDKPNFESLVDTAQDGINYIALMEELRQLGLNKLPD